MSALVKDRASYVRRCKEVECAYLLLEPVIGKDFSKERFWLNKWSGTILDTRCDPAEYEKLISDQEARVARLICKEMVNG